MLWAHDGLPPCGQEDRAGAPTSIVHEGGQRHQACRSPLCESVSTRFWPRQREPKAGETRVWLRGKRAGRALSFLEHQAHGCTPFQTPCSRRSQRRACRIPRAVVEAPGPRASGTELRLGCVGRSTGLGQQDGAAVSRWRPLAPGGAGCCGMSPGRQTEEKSVERWSSVSFPRCVASQTVRKSVQLHVPFVSLYAFSPTSSAPGTGSDFWPAEGYLTSHLSCSQCGQVTKFWSL